MRRKTLEMEREALQRERRKERLSSRRRLAGRIEIKSLTARHRDAQRGRTARPSGTCCCTARRVPVRR